MIVAVSSIFVWFGHVNTITMRVEPLNIPNDGIADKRLFAYPEPVVDRDMEPRPGPVVAGRLEMDQPRIAPVPIQRSDRLGLPADDELDEGLDVRLLDQIAILGDGDQADN